MSSKPGHILNVVVNGALIKSAKTNTKGKLVISTKALRQFAENRRVFNNAVEKAIEENKKAGISEEQLYAQ